MSDRARRVHVSDSGEANGFDEGNQGNILFAAEVPGEIRSPAAFSEPTQALLNGAVGAGDIQLLSVEIDLARALGNGTENRLHSFGTSGSHQTGKAQNLTFMELEAFSCISL